MKDEQAILRRRTECGATRLVAVAIVAVFVLLGLAAWLLIVKPHREIVRADTEGRPLSMAASPAEGGAAPADVASMNLDQLLAEARRAINEQRLLAPAGNNAFENYLKALEKQPDNQVAADALRETFPFGATSAEQAINQRQFEEAQRQIDLLAQADPSNYTLTILRSKLDAQRRLQDREQQQASDQQRQQQAAAASAAASPAPVPVQPQAEVSAPAPAPAPPPAAPSPPSRAPAAPQLQDAVLIKPYQPRYPIAAMRASQEGWVEVEFTVTAGGDVDGLKVVDAQPHHVFDRAATDAVSRWKFKPAMQDGEPVASQVRRRIEFKLSE